MELRKNQTCVGCADTIVGRAYGALDGTEWCESCALGPQEQVRENYAQEDELALVDRHALVLELLLDAQERRSPGWPASSTPTR